MGSEAVLVGLIMADQHAVWALLLVATLPDASGLLSGMSGTAHFAEPK